MTNTRSEWDPVTGILRTNLTGPVTIDDVAAFREGLYRELAEIPDGGTFRLLLNLHGFEPVNLEAHKAMRTIVPEILARHGLRPAFIDLFDERPEVEITVSRGVRCIAFANVHHDEVKMTSYEQRIGQPNQRFFTDVNAAEIWLRNMA
jgi:hypothetical protein